MARNYDQFAVTGLKVEWFPTSTSGHVNPNATTELGGVIESVTSIDDADTYDLTGYTPDMKVALESYRQYDTKAPVRIYRDNRPLAAQQKAKYIDTNASTTAYNENPKGSLMLSI